MYWPTVSLEEISESIVYGLNASATIDEHGPRFLRITDIHESSVDWNAVPSCECTEKELEKFRLSSGDIVFARTGATTGKSYLIRNCPTDSVFASYLIRVRLNQKANPEFISHFFKSPIYWAQVRSTAVGAAQPGINATKLKKMRIPLPPINEQKRIATILDKASEISQNTEQAFEKREGLKNSVFIELFGDPLNTSQWQKVSFLDGVQDVTRSQSKIPQKEFLESGVLPIIDQGRQNIGGWTNDPSLVCTVPLPNIIFGDHTGVLKFLDFPYALGADGVKVLIPKDLNFEPFFLYHLLRFLPLPDVGYSRHYKFLKQFMLICPPIQLQRKFERIVNSINQIPESAGLAKENAQSILQEMLT